ncbi:MAG: hypothetical protein J1F32_03650 [Erysipelotrichales bacterium]|nr:hypothetical protein [Erysipelotrichales bacterium]
MKKEFNNFSILSFLVIVMSLILSSCGNNSKYFFSKSVLEDNLVPDLPRINSTKVEKENSKTYRFHTTEEEFTDYVSSVYEYLCSLNFKYFGYRGDELLNFFGGAPVYEFHYGSELADFKLTNNKGHELDNSYLFVWSNELDTKTNNLSPKYYLQMSYFANRDTNVYIDLNYVICAYKLLES